MMEEFTNPALVAIYDAANGYQPGTQPDFYLALAEELDAKVVLDLGCGTGIITCLLGRHGFDVIGVDPSAAMLELARSRVDAGPVRWIHGDASTMGTPGADLAIMTGHVAQFFWTDTSWAQALTPLHAALAPGGRLAFEARDPAAAEWRTWGRKTRNRVVDPVEGPIELWFEVHRVHRGIVEYAIHYVFATSGKEMVAESKLRFRSESEWASSLARAGFVIEQVYGGWGRQPVGPSTRELVFVAARS